MTASPRPSIIIAAHNEEQVIGRCLDDLLADLGPAGADITVVANGCTDRTAEVAAARTGVRVIDRPQPGKADALNAGDSEAVGFPRLYLDADVVLSPGAIAALTAALAGERAPLAVVPARRSDLRGRPLLVRAYFAINRHLPAYHDGLFGRGAIALSAQGRARFDSFPTVIADDLYLDSLFAREEKREVSQATSTVSTPRRTSALINRLVRVRAGNTALRAAHRDQDRPVRQAARFAWLRSVVLPRPWLAPAAVCYLMITLLAAARARRDANAATWRRDETTRQGTPLERASE